MRNLFYIIFYGTFFNVGNIQSQVPECNKSVWLKRFSKLLPKEICLPRADFHITEVYDKTDVNNDGLQDFIFDWNKKILNDGDTIFVTIYKQISDSSFFPLHTFKNLYPIYFKSYNLDYTPLDAQLKLILAKYDDFYPLIELKIKNDIIEITRKSDAISNLIITYKFDKKLNNWVYEKCIDHNIIENTDKTYDLSKKLGPTIDNFTYFIWDE